MLPLCPVFLNNKNKGGAISIVHLTIVDCLSHSGESKLFIATVVTQLPFKNGKPLSQLLATQDAEALSAGAYYAHIMLNTFAYPL